MYLFRIACRARRKHRGIVMLFRGYDEITHHHMKVFSESAKDFLVFNLHKNFRFKASSEHSLAFTSCAKRQLIDRGGTK